MRWTLAYLPEAEKDLRALDGNQRILVQKAIKKGAAKSFTSRGKWLWKTTRKPKWK